MSLIDLLRDNLRVSLARGSQSLIDQQKWQKMIVGSRLQAVVRAVGLGGIRRPAFEMAPSMFQPGWWLSSPERSAPPPRRGAVLWEFDHPIVAAISDVDVAGRIDRHTTYAGLTVLRRFGLRWGCVGRGRGLPPRRRGVGRHRPACGVRFG